MKPKNFPARKLERQLIAGLEKSTVDNMFKRVPLPESALSEISWARQTRTKKNRSNRLQ